jgi:hypothetical protein
MHRGLILALICGVALTACSSTLSQDEADALYDGLPAAKKAAVKQAYADPPGQTTGNMLVALMFADRCDGIAADRAFFDLMEPRLKADAAEEDADSVAQMDAAMARLGANYDVPAASLRSAETGCPIALQEIGAYTVIGSALFVEGA